jgi:hypothetical protein
MQARSSTDSAICNCMRQVGNIYLSRNVVGATYLIGEREPIGLDEIWVTQHAEIDFAEQFISDHDLGDRSRAALPLRPLGSPRHFVMSKIKPSSII